MREMTFYSQPHFWYQIPMINSYTKQTALVRRSQRQIRRADSPIPLEREQPSDKNPLQNYPNLRRRTAFPHNAHVHHHSRISNNRGVRPRAEPRRRICYPQFE